MAQTERIRELGELADQIEAELELCKNNSKKIGTVSVKLQSFCKMLDRENQGDPAIRKMLIRKKYFLNQIRALGSAQAKERSDMEREMAECNMPVATLSETHDPVYTVKDRDFFAQQSSHIDDFIHSTMDSLDAIKRQGVYIDRTRMRLSSGLERLGVSGELIGRIESRVARDKSLFIVLFVLVVFSVLMLRFYFK
ncbi:hypothetical protein PAPHI01_0543 [Pancytospora philotis]|nr:hypothetical protein PAPHI01_0543 [Pancytospora philotis]